MLPKNQKNLEAIDSAVLVLCLDDKEPTTPVQVSHSMLYGDAANRQAVITISKFYCTCSFFCMQY